MAEVEQGRRVWNLFRHKTNTHKMPSRDSDANLIQQVPALL